MIVVTSTVFPRGEEKYFINNFYGELCPHEAYQNIPNIGMVAAYQGLYDKHKTDHDIIAFMHDDVSIADMQWLARVRLAFDDDTAIVGFGGATGLGVDDIYKTPYRIEQLQRIDYYSNQVGWEIHGKRETGVRDVATVDGYFMAVRTEFLRQTNGWSFFPFAFHNYDHVLALEAHRRGWKVKIVGVECEHHGGGTSTSAEYWEWCRENGTTPELEHTRPHEWMYNRYRDLLPLRVK